jgi:lipopolysaccharide transport system ATP-binding protein
MSKVSEEILVEARNVSKKFSKNFKKSLWYGLVDVIKAVSGIKKSSGTLRTEEFWAVKDINFTLRRGECIGLIGHNGAGKSTLLKMLNGLIRPDEGEIIMRGRVGALIELGAGFNPVLTGRENVYVNGQILGFSKKEIDRKLEEIIKFAEIGDFLDSPVQNYSSGMKVRLGFAVAAQMEPDVLIIDEVLAVGDLGFILKCFNTIDKLLEKTAVIFVSHSMPMISRMCSDIIFMEKGMAVFQGKEVSKAMDLYYSRFSGHKKILYSGNNEAELLELQILSEKFVDGVPALSWGENLSVILSFKVRTEYTSPYVAIIIMDKEQRPIGIVYNEDAANSSLISSSAEYNFYKTKVNIDNILLSKGIYTLSIFIAKGMGRQPLLRINSVQEFIVQHPRDVWEPLLFNGRWEKDNF